MKKFSASLIFMLLLFAGLYGLRAWQKVGDFQHKLWLHRCNSIEKMQTKEDVYENVEIDVVYRGNALFDVTHDEDTTFGLKLDPFLQSIAVDNDRLWLDIKNMTTANCVEMEQNLDSLCKQYGVYRNQLIVESKNVKALGYFTNDDFYTSYYVPFDHPSKLTDEEIAECIDSLQIVADSKKVCALSFPGWWYREIKDNLDRPIDLLAWKHRTTQWEFFLSPQYTDMLFDDQLKVILIKSKGPFHR